MGRPLWVLAPWNARRWVPRSITKIAPGNKVKVATPSPVPSSGLLAPLDGLSCARGPRLPLAKQTVHRDAPTFRGLVSCRSRSWCGPSEPSPPEEPCPLSQASASVRVRVRSVRGAAWRGVSRSLSPGGLVPLPSPVPEDVRATPGGATWIPATAVRTLSGHGARPTTRNVRVAVLATHDLPEPSIVSSSSRARRERPARPLRSLAPPGSPFTRPRGSCRNHDAGPVLSWAFLSPELAPVTIQVRCVAVELGDHRFRGDGRWLAPLSRGLRLFPSRQRLAPLPLGSSCRKRSHPACSAEPSLRPRGLEPGGRRRARSIEPSVPPPGSSRSRPAFMNAHRIRRQPRC